MGLTSFTQPQERKYEIMCWGRDRTVPRTHTYVRTYGSPYVSLFTLHACMLVYNIMYCEYILYVLEKSRLGASTQGNTAS